MWSRPADSRGVGVVLVSSQARGWETEDSHVGTSNHKGREEWQRGLGRGRGEEP